MAKMPMSSRCYRGRDFPPIWIALHTSEGTDTPHVDDAKKLRDATWWEGSSHAVMDDVSLLSGIGDGCVDYDDIAWTLRNGNPISVNAEQIGQAGWSRDEWLSNRMPTLRNAAQWVADMHRRYGIPLRALSIEECSRGLSGVIQHNTYTKGYNDGTHWDCGPGYPIDVVIGMAVDIAYPPTPPPRPKRRQADMFLFAKRGPDGQAAGGKRLFTSAAAPILTDLTDANSAEISEALADPTHVALLGAEQYELLVTAMRA